MTVLTIVKIFGFRFFFLVLELWPTIQFIGNNNMIENQKIVAIIQARMRSTRLPGKVMKRLANKPVLWHVVSRLKHAKMIDQIVVATTNLPEDRVIVEFCLSNNIDYFCGSSQDVLSRYYETAKQFQASIVVRITADSPVIEPKIIDKMIERFNEKNESGNPLDYLSNRIVRSFPPGLIAEVFSFKVLSIAQREAMKDYEREHVTPFIYQHPDRFSLVNFQQKEDHTHFRLTLDIEEDYELITLIY
ncbi:MAG: cytidylyltransferase domain-containing protein, partial [Candidatus Hodarchaeota archaeon]